MLIGSTDTPGVDVGKLRVTVHHNRFDNVLQRAPRVRFGQVDVYNNYYVATSPNYQYSLGVGVQSAIYAQNNYFRLSGAAGNVIHYWKGTAITAIGSLTPAGPVDLVAAYNAAVVGFADYTLDDAVDELTEPGFEPETDGWLVFDGDRLVGYGSIFGKGEFQVLDMDAVTSDPLVEAYLLGVITRRAQELGAAHGHTSVQLDTGVYRQDSGRRERLESYGYVRGTTFHRMRIDHSGPVAVPEVPAGVTVRRGTPDEQSQREAHAVLVEAFEGQYGFEKRPFEEWRASHEAQSTFDWSGITLLELEGKAVALCECTDAFVEDENCNYIARLAVLEEARGRGLAKYLLRDQFALDAAAGRTGTLLHVDTNNPTPALGLYLAVGMTESLVIDSLRRTVTV